MPAHATRRLAPNGKPFFEIAADPSKGFHYPYLIFIPPASGMACFPYLLVEPNNAGGVSPDDAGLIDARQAAVKVATSGSLGNAVAQRLDAPLLVPVFPRPAIGDSDLDTYSLTRAALLVPSGRLKRIDLQLIAMVNDAQDRLRQAGHMLSSKIMIEGYSGSGLFASRFVFLHPDMVRAAAFGGVNGFVMLPVAHLHGHALEYPLGLADYVALTGHRFDGAAYGAVPQLALMGENDTNDGVPNDDEYTADERDLIFLLLGKKMLPDRWSAVRAVYATQRNSVQFKTYTQIGHGLDERVYRDVANLFLNAATGSGKTAKSADHGR